MRLRLIILLIIIFLFIGDINKVNSTTYRSLVDYKGFFKVAIENTGEIPKYENHTLNINIGDKIIWINDDDDAITIISQQGLWENKSAFLKYTGRRFNYTFNNPGIYTFYANRYNALLRQTVIVSSNKINSTVSTTTIPTISPSADITTIRPTVNPTITSSTPSIDNTNTTTITTINIGNTTDDNMTNPILLPLNILDNVKLTGIITFAIIMILSFIRDARKNGRKI